MNTTLLISLNRSSSVPCSSGPSLPDIAGGGAQSTSQDLPSLDLIWVETKSKKAALKVCRLIKVKVKIIKGIGN